MSLQVFVELSTNNGQFLLNISLVGFVLLIELDFELFECLILPE